MSRKKQEKDRGSSPLFRTDEEYSGSKAFSSIDKLNSAKYANGLRQCFLNFNPTFQGWGSDAPSRNKARNMTTNENRIPRLIRPKKENKDQRWVVEYYLWNPSLGKYQRKRNYSLNSEPIKDRPTAFVFLKNELLKLMHESEFSTAVPKDIKNASIYKALQLFGQSKKVNRKQTTDWYDKGIRYFSEWLKSQAFNGGVAQITPATCLRYVEYLSVQRGVNNRTIKNYVDSIKTAFNEWKRAGVITESPWANVKLPTPDQGKNIAFTHEQVDELLRFTKHEHEGLYRLCKFMYYSLARPNEISHLQVKHIGMNRPDQIYLPAEYSKNSQARYIVINADFMKFLSETGIMDQPKDWYIFGKGFMPGPEYYDSKNFGTRYRKRILAKLNYPDDYTLYSWKHTGVMHAYLNGMKPAGIRMQLGHINDGSFEDYLKSLGLFENPDIF